MPWHKQHKSQTKDKILQSAARLFSLHGYDSISIDMVMKDAQLTRGAFYAHFTSKSDLYSQSIPVAGLAAKALLSDNDTLDFCEMSQHYLAQTPDDTKQMCPLAMLISDIRHREPEVKQTYTQVFSGFVKHAESHTQDRASALQLATLLIGGAALAQTLTDDKLKQELLQACESLAKKPD